MKKYIKPVLEVIEADSSVIMVIASQTPWVDGKSDDLFDDDFVLVGEEGDDDSWNPSKQSHNFWDD